MLTAAGKLHTYEHVLRGSCRRMLPRIDEFRGAIGAADEDETSAPHPRSHRVVDALAQGCCNAGIHSIAALFKEGQTCIFCHARTVAGSANFLAARKIAPRSEQRP